MKYLLLLLFPLSAIAAGKEVPLSKIEEGFWECDYASTNSLMDMGEAAVCSTIFEELKTRKFKGDWPSFMSWWKANKESEYKKLKAKK